MRYGSCYLNLPQNGSLPRRGGPGWGQGYKFQKTYAFAWFGKRSFEERCKSAGEKIYQTVENVEGITLLNVPKETPQGARNDPMWEDAVFSWGGPEAEYVKKFLYWEIIYDDNPMRIVQSVDPRPSARETQIRLWGIRPI